TTNEIYVWGSNYYGQLGLGHNQNQNSPQKLNLPVGEEKVRNAPFSNLAGKSGAFSSPVKKIICGGLHSIAITATNEVYVWGYNEYGQLGLGHNQDQNSPQKLNLPAGEEKVRNAPFSNLAGKSRAFKSRAFSSPVKK